LDSKKEELHSNLESKKELKSSNGNEQKKGNYNSKNMNFLNSFMDNNKPFNKNNMMNFAKSIGQECKNKFIDNKLLGKIGEIIKNEVNKGFNNNVDQNEV